MAALLVRPPPVTLAQGIVSHIADERESVSHAKAKEQWLAYCQVFREHGWAPVVVDQADDLPDSVFVEDGVIRVQSLYSEAPSGRDGIFIIASPGTATRRGETAAIQQALHDQVNVSPTYIKHIEPPGTLDGGDILKVPALKTIYVGQSARTNGQGLQQFRELVTPLGWTVQGVPVKKALHLKSMLTALPDGTVIGYEPFVEDTSVFKKFIAMPEPEGVAVVFLDPRNDSQTPLLLSSSATQSAKLLRQLGYEVVCTEVSEFEAGGMCDVSFSQSKGIVGGERSDRAKCP